MGARSSSRALVAVLAVLLCAPAAWGGSQCAAAVFANHTDVPNELQLEVTRRFAANCRPRG